MWIRRLMRTALAFLVTMTVTQKLDADIGTWTRLDDGITMDWPLALATDEHRFYTGAENGIFISLDRGGTWHATSFKENCSTITVDWNTVYAGTANQGVFRSDDRGKTWKPIRNGLPFRELDDGERRYGAVRRILARRGEVVNVMYHGGTYTSTDRGETWHDVSEEWLLGDSIYSIMEFDGYLWSSISLGRYLRSPDHGQTWERLPTSEIERVNDWAVFNNRLYVAGGGGIGQWNDEARNWEYPMEGLPTNTRANPWVHTLAVHEGRLFAGLERGVHVFDERAKTWFSVGLDKLEIYALLSYEPTLYASAGNDGIHRAEIPRIQPHGKLVLTWAHVKQGTLTKD